jgi:hypothetical protein
MKGSQVHIVYLDPEASGTKVGLDDFIAAKAAAGRKPTPELLARAERELRPIPRDDSADDAPYAATPAGIVYRKPTQNGLVDQLLSNFTARIVEEVIADDGASERAELAIEGELGGKPLPRIRVPSRRFSSLDWVNGEWGARPIVNAGMGNRDRVREGIQRLSPEIARRRVFEHSGWRLTDAGWCYLHAGGAIGADGAVVDVDVALRGAASRILFPDPPRGEELREAVRCCLSLLEVAPDHITAALLGAVYRALLCEVMPADVSLFLVGPTGVFKSELAALAMQHIGAGFDRLNLPAHWSATANFLERAAFDFKDAPLVIDDFAPGGSQIDVARLHATADRVGRGVGNRGGRGRMHADGTLRPDYPPRGLVIGTGEDAPRGQSLRSRMMILEVAPGDVRRDLLTAAQDAGRRGVFVGGLGGFVQHLAPQLDALCVSLPAQLGKYRDLAHRDSSHARTPDAVAHLALGWWAFLRYAAAVGVVTETDAQATFERVWSALGVTAARQASHQASEEPARRFIDLLGSALAGGFAHVASAKGGTPFPYEPWGWREVLVGVGESQRVDWRPEGARAGWVEDGDLYIDLEAAIAAAQRVSQATGNPVAVSPKTLAKRLHERGFLKSVDSERGSLRVRRMLQGSRRAVLHLAASAIVSAESAQSAQSAQDGPKSSHQSDPGRGNGGIPWAEIHGSSQESAQENCPNGAERRGSGQVGQIGQVLPA